MMSLRTSIGDVQMMDIDKANTIHNEKPQDITEITSAFANLTRGQAIRKFRRQYATVLLTSLGTM